MMIDLSNYKNPEFYAGYASQKRSRLESLIMSRLGIKRAEYEAWKMKDYSADPEISDRFLSIIAKVNSIHIIGDYDCDGACASHILETGLHELFPNKDIKVRIPHRFTEGYGINEKIVDEIVSSIENPSETLILTCDNGIAAKDVLEKAKRLGFRVIVTDHHELNEEVSLPEVDLCVDPKIKRLYNPFKNDLYCGAGVAYKLLEPRLSEKTKHELKAFAALATVADVMKLQEENWWMVRQVMLDMRKGDMPKAFRYILDAYDVNYQFADEKTFGFTLGPTVNALGRMMDNGIADVLEYFKNPTKEGAEYLVSVNEERKNLVKDTLERVEEHIKKHQLQDDYPMWINMDNIHEGIVGIVAGNLATSYNRPCIMTTYNEEKGCLKGSARSHDEKKFDIYHYLYSMKDKFISMGGHPGAAGLSLTEEDYEYCSSQIEKRLKGTEHIEADLDIFLGEIPAVFTEMDGLRPFGEGNPEPVFKAGNIDTKRYPVKFIGSTKDHLSIRGGSFNVIGFSMRTVYEKLQNKEKFNAVGTIGVNVWNGVATPQFMIQEITDAER